MMRTVAMLALLGSTTACGWGSSPEVAPTEPTTAPLVEGSEPATPEDGAAQLTAYIDTVCRLYTEPACVTAQKGTCSATVSFPDTAKCAAFLQQAASTCDGLTDQLAAHKADVDACRASVSRYTCGGAEPMCDASGERYDTRGACATVAGLIAACDVVDDTGL